MAISADNTLFISATHRNLVHQNGRIIDINDIGYSWGVLDTASNSWTYLWTPTKYRLGYPSLLPGAPGEVSFIGKRVVEWEELAFTDDGPDYSFDGPPNGSSKYMFNKLYYYSSNDYAHEDLVVKYSKEATVGNITNPCIKWRDVYVDTEHNIHILYLYRGVETIPAGEPSDSSETMNEMRTMILSPNGEVLADRFLWYAGNKSNVNIEPRSYGCMFQIEDGSFYLLASGADRSVLLYPAGQDGLTFGDPIDLHIPYPLRYSGIQVAKPSRGTPLSNIVDATFLSDEWTAGNRGDSLWQVYIRLNFNQ